MNLKSLLKASVAVLAGVLLSACTSLHQEGMNAFQSGNTALAEQKILAAIRGGDVDAWNNLGVIYERTGRQELANRAYQMAARYGNATAQQNLIAKGLPVPPADLRKAPAPISPVVAEMLRQSTAKPAAPAAVESTRPAPIRFCDSKVSGSSVSTTCY